jgi:hypothetical protein
MNVVLGGISGVYMDSIEDNVGTSFADNEVTTESILEKLVVSTFARSLVDIPPSVVKVGVVRSCVVKLTDPDGSEKPLVERSNEIEGDPSDRLAEGTTGGGEELPMGRVAEKEKSAVSSDKDPGRTDGLDVEAATEVASGVTSDALKVPVVYTTAAWRRTRRVSRRTKGMCGPRSPRNWSTIMNAYG